MSPHVRLWPASEAWPTSAWTVLAAACCTLAYISPTLARAHFQKFIGRIGLPLRPKRQSPGQKCPAVCQREELRLTIGNFLLSPISRCEAGPDFPILVYKARKFVAERPFPTFLSVVSTDRCDSAVVILQRVRLFGAVGTSRAYLAG